MEERSNIGFIESCDVPSVYSNKQSYYEVLCYINYKLNELIDVYNSIELDYKTYVDGQLDSVKSYADKTSQDAQENAEEYTNTKASATLDSAKKYTEQLNDTLNAKVLKNIDDIADLYTKLTETNSNLNLESINRKKEDDLLDAKIIEVSNSNVANMVTLRKLITTNKKLTDESIAYEIDNLKEYVNTHYLETTTVMNPWRGKETNYQSVIDDIFRVYRPLSMSVNELNNILPEVQGIDEIPSLTVGDIDFNGLRVKQYLSDAYVFSVVTGKYVTIQDAYYELVRLLSQVPKDPLSESDIGNVDPSYRLNALSSIDESTLSSAITVSDMDVALNSNSCVTASLSLYNVIGSPV